MRTFRYLGRRLLSLVLVLVGVSILTFFLSHVIPGDPARLIAGPQAGQEAVDKVREQLGLDRPLVAQYVNYMRDLLHGDLGTSIHTRRPVLADLKAYFPATLELSTMAMLFALLAGVPIGVYAAVRPGKGLDTTSRFLSLAGVAVPVFFLGLMLQLWFGYGTKLLPIGGRVDYTYLMASGGKGSSFYLLGSLFSGNWGMFGSALRHTILPALTLASGAFGVVLRMSRAAMLEVLGEHYMRTAHSYGFSQRRVYFRYALRNALPTIITSATLSYGFLLGGDFLVEAIFDWPGVGLYALESILTLDYPAVMGVVLLSALVYVLVNTAADLLYAVVDPRVARDSRV